MAEPQQPRERQDEVNPCKLFLKGIPENLCAATVEGWIKLNMGVAADDGRIDRAITADGEPTAAIFAMSKNDADQLMQYWRDRNLVMRDVDNNPKFMRLQRDHSSEVRMKLRLLGCIWTAVQARQIPDGWHLEGTGTRGRLLAAQGEGADKVIRSLVKIATVERSGRAEVYTLPGADEFLQQPIGTLDKLIAEATREADLRPRR